MFEEMLRPLRRYADLKGRASRSEFWLFMLFCAVVLGVARILDGSLSLIGPFSGLVGLLLICPQIAVAVRRLHDVGRSGKELILPYALLAAMPLVAMLGGFMMKAILLGYAGLVLLMFAHLLLMLIKKGSSVPNRYGSSPTAFSFAK